MIAARLTGVTRRWRYAAAVVLCSSASAAVLAQNAAQAPRAQGTASISGQVVSADTGQPIAGAEVRAAVLILSNPAGTPPPPPVRAITNEAGRFELRGLSAGRLSLTATAPGYLTGSYRPGLQSQMPQIREGQRLAGVTIELSRAASITGTVKGADGRPLANVEVRIFRRGILTVRRAWLDIRAQFVTDASGQYAAENLSPGEYIVSVPVVATTYPKSVLEAVRAVPPPEFNTSPIVRAMVDSRAPMPGPSLEIAGLNGVVMTGGLASRPVPLPAVAPGSALRIYRTTYYPAETTLDAAGIVTLKSGERHTGVDIVLQGADAFHVTGTLTRNAGPAAFTGVHLIAEDAAERSIDYDGVAGLTVTDGAGVFSFANIPPGNYSVKVVILPVPSGQGNPLAPPASRLTAWAAERVRVADRDVELGPIALHPPLTVSGRVEFSGAGAMSPARNGRATVWLATVDGGMYSPPAAVPIDSEGRFALTGAMRGRYHLSGGSYPGWTVASVTAGGEDITANALVVEDRDIGDVVIRLTGRAMTLAGRVVDSTGQPANGAEVIVFPSNYKTWIANGLSNRVMRRAGTGGGGVFGVSGLPPGLYLAAALPAGSLDDWPDRRVFESVALSAMPVALAEGKPVEVTLPLVTRRPAR